MTSNAMYAPSGSTAAGVRRQVSLPVLGVVALITGLGTVGVQPAGLEMALCYLHLEQTSAGASIVIADRAGAAIAELRRLSGFTWDQLARLFKVSRRSLHFWASGKAMTPSNEEHLQRLLAVVRKIDRGSASINRSALLAVQDDRTIAYDLLADEQYDRVVTLLGPGGARRVKAPKLSAEAMAARAPRPPEELVGALQDRVHASSGRLLAARAVQVPRRK